MDLCNSCSSVLNLLKTLVVPALLVERFQACYDIAESTKPFIEVLVEPGRCNRRPACGIGGKFGIEGSAIGAGFHGELKIDDQSKYARRWTIHTANAPFTTKLWNCFSVAS